MPNRPETLPDLKQNVAAYTAEANTNTWKKVCLTFRQNPTFLT